MPPVPLALSAHKRSDALQPETLCINFYLEEDTSGASPDKVMRLQRPGLTTLAATAAAVRGIFRQQGLLSDATFVAAGASLYTLSGAVLTSVGSVGSSGRVPMAGNYEKLFLLSGTSAYSYGGSLSAISMPDSRAVQDIDTLNNFLILACPDGRFYWLEPGSGTVEALNFATAESAPDGLIAVRRLVDELWFFGRSTIEVWQPTGDLDAPFLRAGGRVMERGCLARDTVQRFDNSLVWVGEDCIVYRAGNVPQRISDHSIEERLRKRIGDPSAMVLEHDGHKFYVLQIPGQGSFVHDPASPVNGVWPEFKWAAGAPYVAERGEDGTFILGDEVAAALYTFDPNSNQDAGTVMERRLTGTLAFMGRAGRQDSLSIGLGASADLTLKVRWQDGQDGYPSHYDEIEVRAPYDVANLYRLGQPDHPYRTFDILVDEDVKVRISGAMANEAWR